MRTTLAGGLLDVLRTNLARKHERVRVFEVGRCFLRDGERRPTSRCASGASPTARRCPSSGGSPKRPVDFHDVKGDLEALVAPWTLATDASPHPLASSGPLGAGHCSTASGRLAGRTPPAARQGIRVAARARRLRARRGTLARAARCRRPNRCPKLPVVRRDFAVVVDEAVPAGALLDALGRRQAAAGGCASGRSTSIAGPGYRLARKALRFWCLCRILNVL